MKRPCNVQLAERFKGRLPILMFFAECAKPFKQLPLPFQVHLKGHKADMSLRSRYTSFIFVQLWDSGMYYKGIKKKLGTSVVAFLLSCSDFRGQRTCLWPKRGFFFLSQGNGYTDVWTPHLDQELRGSRLTRGVAGVRDDVQSDLGPRFLERMSGRRLLGKVVTFNNGAI